MRKSLKSAHIIQEIISFSNKRKRALLSKSYIIHYKQNDLGYPRFCFAVSKKGRNAPEKNLVKRQLREMTKDIENISYDFVIIPRILYTKYTFLENKENLIKLLKQVKGE